MNNWEVIIVAISIIFLIISLYAKIIGPVFSFIITVIFLGLAGILTPKEILNGFANEQIFVILFLLLIGELIRKTEMIEVFFDKIFHKGRNYRGFLFRMSIWIGSFSTFINNTPLVAVMMPYVSSWSKKNKIASSKLLIPLSYATILGGCVTLVGTSTNLIVNGLLKDQELFPHHPGFNLFDFTPVGLTMLIIGILYLTVFSNRLLPNKTDIISDYTSNSRKYIIEAKVKKNSHLIGLTVEEAGINNLDGLLIVEIRRENCTITSPSKEDIIKENDLLFFAGDTTKILEIINNNSGLSVPEIGMMYHKKETEIIEIVISHNSTLISKTIKEACFRSKYDAAIIAIHRNGERIKGKIGNIPIKAGDSLLLFTGKNFDIRTANTSDFYLISKIKEIQKVEFYKIATLLGGTILAIILSALNILPFFLGLISVIIISMLLKIASPKDIHKSMDFNLAVIIALSLAIGTAMTKTGFADIIATGFIKTFIPYGKIGLITGLYLITTLLAAFITTRASIAIIFPIAITLAKNANINPIPFALVVAYASAANFLTPIGYQTNLMVYGPGSYTFKDYFKIGLPLTILYGFFCIIILSYYYQLY